MTPATRRNKRSLFAAFATLVIVAPLLFFIIPAFNFMGSLRDHFLANDYTQADIDCSKARAQPILDAIHAFKAARGSYPPSLEAVAAFANITIPNCCMSDMPYRYGVSDDGTYFSLTFAASDAYYPCWYWDSRIQRWYADQ